MRFWSRRPKYPILNRRSYLEPAFQTPIQTRYLEQGFQIHIQTRYLRFSPVLPAFFPLDILTMLHRSLMACLDIITMPPRFTRCKVHKNVVFWIRIDFTTAWGHRVSKLLISLRFWKTLFLCFSLLRQPYNFDHPIRNLFARAASSHFSVDRHFSS